MRVIMAAFAVMLTFIAAATPADAKRVLRLAIQAPLKSVLGRNVVRFKEEVEKATAGGLEVQIFDSGQLFDERDLPAAVGAGQVEMGVVSLAGYARSIPAIELFNIPFLFDEEAKLRAAVAPGAPIRLALDEAIAATGARVLWWQAYGGTVLVSKGVAIKSPRDLRGRRVRVVSALLKNWVVAHGGIPVDVPAADQYAAYQRGTVDIGVTSPATIKTRRLWEVMDTVTVTNVGVAEFIVVINEELHASLSDIERAVVAAAAAGAEAAMRQDMAQVERDALEIGRQNKMAVYSLTPAETDVFRASASVVRDAFLATSGDLGQRVYQAAVAAK